MTIRTSSPHPAVVRREVSACVTRTLADVLGIDEDVLEPDLSLADDLAVDSLELLEVAVTLEAALGVAYPRRELEHVRTCGQLLTLTLSLLEPSVVRDAPASRMPLAPARDPWSGCCYAA
jgi:acyl carrier protein